VSTFWSQSAGALDREHALAHPPRWTGADKNASGDPSTLERLELRTQWLSATRARPVCSVPAAHKSGDPGRAASSQRQGPPRRSQLGAAPANKAHNSAQTPQESLRTPIDQRPTRRIAVAVSGGGRSLDNLAELAGTLQPPIQIALMLADRPGIGAFAVAEKHQLPQLLIEPNRFSGRAAWSAALFAAAEAAEAELLVLAGFLRRLLLPPDWHGRVLNIHPSLLPKYGGQGFYGNRVHAAVLAAGDTESGCTVHYVDDHYDQGPPLLQRRVPVLPNDDVAQLAARVFAAECEALPTAIEHHFATQRR
jgi:phosphoribosylglycinamide formyltransferase-1